jgi:type II secretory pathway predicted ATPase ExeA
MSEILDFHGFERSPFADEAHASVVIGTRALRKVVSRIQATVRDGGARIGVLGAPGIGKTSLARALPKLLAGNTRVAAILDPGEDWKTLRLALARDWQLGGGKLARAGLLGAARGHRLVLVVDRAEQTRPALLRHLDALQAIQDTDGAPVVTVVLFVRSGRDEEETRPAALEWLEQSQAALIPFEPLAPEAVADFIERQLQRAGYRGSPLFTPRAALAIHTETNGVPGAIARLCERLLADAAVRRLRTIDEPFVRSRQDARSLQAEIPGRSGDEGGEAWDDADHHPRETPSEELLLVDAIASPPRPAPRLDAPSDVEADLVRDPELEAYLSAPPTAAELRAIRGGFVRRHLWPFAAVSAAAVLGGLLLARVSWQDPVEPVAEPPSSVGVPTGGPPHAPTHGPVLGRLRGPVIAVPAPDARRPAAPPRASLDPTVQIESPLRQAGDLDDSALPAARRVISARDEDSRPLDLRDDRPKDLAPPAGIDPGIP